MSEDDKLFSSYFWYRQYYKPDPPQRKFVKVSFNIFISISLKFFHQIVINYLRNLQKLFQSYCDLCSALHDGGEPGSVIEQFDDWWRGEAACHAAM